MRSNSPAGQDQAYEPPCGLTCARNSDNARSTPPENRANRSRHTTRASRTAVPAPDSRKIRSKWANELGCA